MSSPPEEDPPHEEPLRADATLVSSPAELEALAAALESAPRIAVDLESNGLFAYRAGICVVQIARGDEVFVVDGLTTDARALGALLSDAGPIKVVHDVSFDARLLGEAGIALGRVQDTSIAAQFLGRPKLGLAALLASEVGVTIDKSLQQHDWRVRPLTPAQLVYLAGDVQKLVALADVLWGELRTRGIEAEVEEETRYRLRSAYRAVTTSDPRPPYTKLREIELLPGPGRAIARRLATLRAEAAARADVPLYKVFTDETLITIARRTPRTRSELSQVRGAANGRAASLSVPVLDAVAAGLADGDVPLEDRPFLERPRLAPAIAKARRAREARLSTWRKAEAVRRDVSEQVVLPGHCVKDIVELAEAGGARGHVEADEVRAVDGFGACREHYAHVIAPLVSDDGPDLIPPAPGDGALPETDA